MSYARISTSCFPVVRAALDPSASPTLTLSKLTAFVKRE